MLVDTYLTYVTIDVDSLKPYHCLKTYHEGCATSTIADIRSSQTPTLTFILYKDYDTPGKYYNSVLISLDPFGQYNT